MRVYVKDFGADDGDEQQREPILARGWPAMIEPKRRGESFA
jgi:hypothetical protein